MVIFDYTHAFTHQQLELIITQYLQLGPYYQCLKDILSQYLSRFQSLPLIQRHNPDKQHPIRLPIKCYNFNAKKLNQIDLAQYKGELHYIYPLTSLIQVLNSNQFYLQLPKNIIINGLLTTTNINIIINTLTIVSQELSKLIKSTLASIQQKQLTSYINTLVNDCLQTDLDDEKHVRFSMNGSEKKLSFKNLGFLGLLFQKGLNMLNQENLRQDQDQNENDNEYLTTKRQNKNQYTQSVIGTMNIDTVMEMGRPQSDSQIQSFGNLPVKHKTKLKRNSSRASILASIISASDLNREQTKSVVRTLKSLMGQQSNLKSINLISQDDFQKRKHELEQQFIKKPKIFTQCEYCRNYRNYLLQSTGLSYFDLHQISSISTQTFKVLKRIKNCINVFTLYLKQTNQTTIPANINVINKILSNINLALVQTAWQNSKINPKFIDKTSKYSKKYLHPNQNKSTIKANNLLTQLQPFYKSIYNYQPHSQNQFSIDQLLRICLQAQQLNKIEKQLVEKYMNETRMKKQGKDIEIFCITKQKLNNKINIQLNNQNQLNFDPLKSPFTQQSYTNQIQLLREYQKEQSIINRAKINSKPVYAQINQKYQEQINLSSAINKHKLQNYGRNNNQKSYQISQVNLKQNKKNTEAHENEKFKMIIYQQFMKNQGFNVTKNNMSAIINQNILRGTKTQNQLSKDFQSPYDSDFNRNSDYINPFSNYGPLPVTNNTVSTVYIKTEEDNDTDFDKKETQIYNKMLLNGQTIRSQVLNQVEYENAVIYESYQDFLKKLDEINLSDSDEDQSQSTQNQGNQHLFLTTLCGANLKKTFSGKKGDSKHDDSIKNTKKSGQTANPRKTQNVKLVKKISIQYSKNLNSKQFKKTCFQNITNLSSKDISKKQIKFKKQYLNQSSANQSLIKNQWNEELQLKKPAWLDQYLDKSQNVINSKNIMKNGKTLLENQRFLAFQQKCWLQQSLNSEQYKNTVSLQNSKSNSFNEIVQKRQKNLKKTDTNLKRPMSALALAQSQSKNGTIKSLSRTLSGKKRSFLLGKDFVIENNSLLNKLFKQNIGENVFVDAKKEIEKEKQHNQFKFKIETSKFRVDNFFA